MADNASLIISLAALALSILSPWLSARHLRKAKEMELKAEAERRREEFYDQHRAEVIERYITAVGEICKTELPQDLHAYGKALGEVYLYVDQSLWPLLDTISEKIERHEFQPPTAEFIQLCKALADGSVRSNDTVCGNKKHLKYKDKDSKCKQKII